MKFDITPSFEADLRRMSHEHKKRFRNLVREIFVPACDAFRKNPSQPWPRSLRVKAVQGAPGVLEMTWSFSGPDGRATFELVTLDGELICKWRRVGNHSIFRNP